MSFEDELRNIFIEEVIQLIQDAEQCFLALESTPDDPTLIDNIFRVAHNIKGGAKAIGFNDLGAFAHEFESYLLKVKNKEISINAEVINFMLKCNDQIKYMVDQTKSDPSAHFDNTILVSEIRERILNIGISQPHAVQNPIPAQEPIVMPEVATTQPAVTITEQVPILNPNLNGNEFNIAAEQLVEMNAIINQNKGLSTHQEVAPIAQAVSPAPAQPTTTTRAAVIDESIRVSTSRLEKLLNYIGEMVILQSVLNEQSIGNNPHLLRKTIQEMSKITKEVQDISMSLRMIPMKQTFQKMQRIARDTSTYLNKKIQLKFSGEETEVDKTVLENLSDPLVHIVRNAADHGIESTEARLQAGKSEVGTISFRAYHQGGKLVIEISDDGGGIDHERLTKKAIEKGIFPPGTVLSRQEGINLIFHPGLSSKAEVTEISGRGVGMDVVRSNIEKMNGEVLIETAVGKGSTFKIILPLTLAIIEGMVITNNKNRYVVPLAHIAETVRVTDNDVKKTSTLGDILLLRGENIPLFQLCKLLGRHQHEQQNSECIALVVRNEAQAFAVVVDDILSQQQIVIKKLGNELQYVRGFSGGSILGDGRPSLILELADLVEQYEMKNHSKTNLETRRISA